MSTRLMLIALDGADEGLVQRFCAEGAMPNLAALRAGAARTTLAAPRGLSDDALWASFQYAAPLGEHARYFWRVYDPVEGGLRNVWLVEPHNDSFWDALSAAGRRVAVFDLPKCIVTRDVDGIVLGDWLVHGRYHDEPFSRPARLRDEVLERYGAAPPSLCARLQKTLDDDAMGVVIERLWTSVAMKRDAVLDYLHGAEWDLFMTAFKEIHCVSHLLWNLVDAEHPDFDPHRDALLGEPVKAVFSKVDAALGEIADRVADAGALVVFSTTGFVPTFTLAHLFEDAVDRMDRHLGGLRGLFGRARLPHDPIANRWCSAVPNGDTCGAIRVKVRGRDRGGRVRPGDDYVRVLETLTSWLKELVDVDSGEAVVDEVVRTQQCFPGSCSQDLPDLFVHWGARGSGRGPHALHSATIGRVEAPLPSYRAGDHGGDGWLLAGGGLPTPPRRMTIDEIGAFVTGALA